MPYRAVVQFAHAAGVVGLGQVLADDDPLVVADLDDSNGRTPLQLFVRQAPDPGQPADGGS